MGFGEILFCSAYGGKLFNIYVYFLPERRRRVPLDPPRYCHLLILHVRRVFPIISRTLYVWSAILQAWTKLRARHPIS